MPAKFPLRAFYIFSRSLFHSRTSRTVPFYSPNKTIPMRQTGRGQRLSRNPRPCPESSSRTEKITLHSRGIKISRAFPNDKLRLSSAHCYYVIMTGRATHKERCARRRRSRRCITQQRSRLRERNGVFTTAEHGALIIKDPGYCTDMPATRRERTSPNRRDFAKSLAEVS